MDLAICIIIYLLLTMLMVVGDLKITGDKFVLYSSISIFITLSIVHVCGDKSMDTAVKLAKIGAVLFSFLSVILVSLTLKHNIHTSSKNQISNRFTDAVKYHRENVNYMEYVSPRKKKKTTIHKNRVFVEIYREIQKAVKIVEEELEGKTTDKIYKTLPVGEIVSSTRKIDLKTLAIYDIAYLVVFFGVGSESTNLFLQGVLEKSYENDIVTTVIEKCRERIVEYEPDKKNKVKYFGGHQRRLGHYFRHIFQTVKFIDNSEILDYKEKREYIKTLRAQFSTFEQLVFFFNSISQLGREWELDVKDDSNTFNRHWITKYNLIKNIFAEYVLPEEREVRLTDFYPLVAYEQREYPKGRQKYENMYS